MAARITALFGVLLAVAGCAVPGSAAHKASSRGSTLHTMNSGGLDRSYRLYIPVGLASPAPLVVMMHGGFGSAQQAERAYGWQNELADSAKFVVAYPDGVGRAWNVNWQLLWQTRPAELSTTSGSSPPASARRHRWPCTRVQHRHLRRDRSRLGDPTRRSALRRIRLR